VAVAEKAAMLIACDGMGGHAEGERAAEVAQQTVIERFWQTTQPLIDPLGFLHLSLGAAHASVVGLAPKLPLEMRPRATCAVCVVQQTSAYWAHVGDSRVYHLRAGRLRERTRDHSHVELLMREGVISAGQMQNHPMRNFVESCLGGEALLPEMALNPRRALMPERVLGRRAIAAGYAGGAGEPGSAQCRRRQRQHLGGGAALPRIAISTPRATSQGESSE